MQLIDDIVRDKSSTQDLQADAEIQAVLDDIITQVESVTDKQSPRGE